VHQNAIQEKLTSLLENEFGIKLADIDPDRSIFEQIPIDSMQLVAMSAKIEQSFEIELPLAILEKPTLNNLIRLVTQAAQPS
jgi:acyl carrier protein